jgi:hypothetical protein
VQALRQASIKLATRQLRDNADFIPQFEQLLATVDLVKGPKGY